MLQKSNLWQRTWRSIILSSGASCAKTPSSPSHLRERKRPFGWGVGERRSFGFLQGAAYVGNERLRRADHGERHGWRGVVTA